MSVTILVVLKKTTTMREAYTQTIQEVIQQQQTDSKQGLTTKEVTQRQVHFGKNKIQQLARISPWTILLSQFTDFLVFILIIAAILSYLIGEHIDAIVIGVIVLINGLLGFIQEYRAEKAIEALKKLEAPHALVIRDGKEADVLAEELVPGDVIVLSEGNKVPADARLIQAVTMNVDESLLTGESLSVHKHNQHLEAEKPLAERSNMVFSGSLVTTGKGRGIIVATGMNTEMGKIARLVQSETKAETPLQKKLDELGKKLGFISIGIALPGIVLGIVQGRDLFTLFLTGVSLAVAAIPEGLPIVITIALALGVQKMLRVQALVRRLPIVEVLGGTDVICTDKTGTLTCNAMTVQQIITARGFYVVEGKGFEPEGEVYGTAFDLLNTPNFPHLHTHVENQITPLKVLQWPALEKVFQTVTLCNDATLELGDPTERALVVAAAKLDFKQHRLATAYQRIKEIPFSSERKYMLTVHTPTTTKHTIGFLKGAPEIVLGYCTKIHTDNAIQTLTQTERAMILKANETMARQGLRVLATAYKEQVSDQEIDGVTPKEFIFTGLVGMIDPPRTEVPEAIKICHKAGIRVIMITGDHRLTAQAIAKQIGLESSEILSGEQLDTMSDKEMKKKVEHVSIFARVSSEHKLKILKALQANHHTVAMTGDGVNDAPAIKRADIGISVGSGTDLTKEVSDIILLDDNFATFEKAIKEGRAIYDNVKKFIKFLLSANFGEVLVVLSSLFLSALFNRTIPIMLLPIHILWLNLISDGIPALALSLDPPEKNIMLRKPRKAQDSIFKGLFFFTLITGIIAYLATMFTFSFEYPWWQSAGLTDDLLVRGRTMAFTQIVFFELFFVFACRSEKSVFQPGFFSNLALVLSVIISIVLQIFIVQIPWLQPLFKTTGLSLQDWLVLSVTSTSGLVIMGCYLWFKNSLFAKRLSFTKT